MSDPQRIAYLTSAFARPSDTFIRSEVNRLRDRGIEIHTFSIRRPTDAVGDDEDVRNHQARTEYIIEAGLLRLIAGVASSAIKTPRRFLRSMRLAFETRVSGVRGFVLQMAYLAEAAYLASRIRRLGINHLHNHIGENSATVAMLAACLAEIPYSLTIHGPGIFRAPERWALGVKLDRAKFTACISYFCLSQCMLFAKPATWKRLHVVRCAVGEQFLEPPKRSEHAVDSPLILCIGRLCVDKGQRLLVEAAAELAGEGIRFKLQFVGDGPEREALEQQIDAGKLSDVVEIVGWQSSDTIRQMLLQARLLVLPSFAEGLPIVLMEAMALECPVISTTIAAIGELVTHQENGWLIPPGAIEPLLNVLREALTVSEQELEEMGQCGRRRVLEHHHPRRQTEQLNQLFEAENQLFEAENATESA